MLRGHHDRNSVDQRETDVSDDGIDGSPEINPQRGGQLASYKGGKNVQRRKDSPPDKRRWENRTGTGKTMKQATLEQQTHT